MADTATTTATTPAAGAPETGALAPETPAAAPAAVNTDNGEKAGEGKTTDLEALIRREVDRATNKLGNEKKKLLAEIETLKKAKLSDDEIKQLEMKAKEDELAERDRALTEKENRWFAIKAIKEAGLDDGSDDSLAIVEFVMAEDEDGIREKVKSFSALVERIVKKQVDGVFKSSGRTPGVGSESAANAGGQNDSIAARMGRSTANANKAAQSVLNHYGIGGK